jgi:hypothetical protein
VDDNDETIALRSGRLKFEYYTEDSTSLTGMRHILE